MGFGIRNLVNPEEKKFLRKIRKVPEAVKAAIYGGNLGAADMAMQFHDDVRVYGLYEALLYVERYEQQGKYKPGTAVAALNAAKIPNEDPEYEAPPDNRPGWSSGMGRNENFQKFYRGKTNVQEARDFPPQRPPDDSQIEKRKQLVNNIDQNFQKAGLQPVDFNNKAPSVARSRARKIQ